MNKLKIFLDVDDVVLDFQPYMAERFNSKILKSWSNSKLTKRRLKILMDEKDFWLNIPPRHTPNFIPSGYVSARSIPKEWTYLCLKSNNIPGRSNIHHVGWGKSKIELLKSLNVDIFIDDKYETFKECNKNGIFCLLMDANHNKKYKTDYRIYDLDINKIMQKYENLCNQTLKNK